MKQIPQKNNSLRVHGLTILWALLLIAALIMSASFNESAEKAIGFISLLVILGVCVTPSFRKRLAGGVPLFFLFVAGYVLLGAISTFYADAPMLAMPDYGRHLAGFAAFLLIYAFCTKERLRSILYAVSGATAALSFLIVDTASARWFGGWVYTQLASWIPTYAGTRGGYNVNRLFGLWGNSNTMAFFCAIGILLALYLLLTADRKKARIPALIILFINAFTFIMCVSLGATLAFGLSVLLCLFFARSAQDRFNFLMVTLETLLTVLLAVLVSFNHFGGDYSTGYVVYLAMLGGGALLCVLDIFLRGRLTEILCRRQRVLWAALAGLLVLVIVFVIAVFKVTGPATLNAGESLLRTIYPGVGDAVVTIEADGQGTLSIASRTEEDIQLQGGGTMLLTSVPAAGAHSFTVPEDAVEVRLSFRQEGDAPLTIRSITYEGGEASGSAAPAFRLLPANIAERLNGLRTNTSLILRGVMMRDGIKLWKTAPIIGHGLAGYDNGLLDVQDYYYQTQYAHNHFIQCLCDWGVVGLLVYLGLLVTAYLALFGIRKRREDEDPLYLILFGGVAMVTIHGGIEFTMSVGEGIMGAMVIFALLAVNAEPLPVKRFRGRKSRDSVLGGVVTAVIALFYLVFAVLMTLHFSMNHLVSNTTYAQDLEKAARVDVFCREVYLLNFVQTATWEANIVPREAVEPYLEELEASKVSSAPGILAQYYFAIQEPERAFIQIDRHLDRRGSAPESWDETYLMFQAALDLQLLQGTAEAEAALTEVYIPNFLRVFDYMMELNAHRIDDLSLDSQSISFLLQLKEEADARGIGEDSTIHAFVDSVKAATVEME